MSYPDTAVGDATAQGATPGSRKRARTDDSTTSPSAGSGGGFGGDLGQFQHEAGDGDDDDDDEGRDKKTGRRKIKIEFIQDKSRRHITFSKRKAGIMKKAYELSTLTGTQVLLLVVSETGLVYTFTTAKLQPLVTQPEGKNLIQACLNAPAPQTFGMAPGPPLAPPPPGIPQYSPAPPHPQQVAVPQLHQPPPPPQHPGQPQRLGPMPSDDDDRSTSPAHSQHAASLNAATSAAPSGRRPRRAAASTATYRDGSDSPDHHPSDPTQQHYANGGAPPYGNGTDASPMVGGHSSLPPNAYAGMTGFPPPPNGSWEYPQRR